MVRCWSHVIGGLVGSSYQRHMSLSAHWNSGSARCCAVWSVVCRSARANAIRLVSSAFVTWFGIVETGELNPLTPIDQCACLAK